MMRWRNGLPVRVEGGGEAWWLPVLSSGWDVPGGYRVLAEWASVIPERYHLCARAGVVWWIWRTWIELLRLRSKAWVSIVVWCWWARLFGIPEYEDVSLHNVTWFWQTRGRGQEWWPDPDAPGYDPMKVWRVMQNAWQSGAW